MTEPIARRSSRLHPVPDPAADRPVRVLYIGGCGRSGSTLLDRMLGQIPGLWSVGEIVHIWRRGLVGNQLCGCGVPFHECPFWTDVGRLAFGGWDVLDPDELLFLQRHVDRNRFIPMMATPLATSEYRRHLLRYTDKLARLYRGIQQASGTDFIVDSTKHASYAFLLRRVPGIDLRVVHLARDSRGVAYSWTKEVRKPEITDQAEYMPRYHPGRMAFRWLSYNLLFHLLRTMGTSSLFVRYESLVEHPEREIGRILGFIGHEARPEALEFIDDGAVHLLPTHTVAGNPMRFKQGRLALRRDEQWRVEMDESHRMVVSVLTWPLMRLYGYRMRGRA